MQEEPSGDEVIVLITSLVNTVPFWFRWYFTSLSINAITPIPQRQWLYCVPIACLGSVFLVLTQLADQQVRNNEFYLALFLAISAFVLQLINGVANLLGMGAISNGIERRNGAAIWAICGAWLGATACIIGSNIGSGSTIYTTTESLFLSVGALIVLWMPFALLTRNPVAIAVDRDVASGLRLAGVLIAWGIILGQSVVGDWVSTAATITDVVRQAWMTLPLLGIAIVIEQRMQPNKRHPLPPIREAGWYPVIGYGAITALWLLFLASWR